jgi:uncharacterized protein (TIGR02145 family)
MNQDGTINDDDLPIFTTANTTAAHGYIVSDLNGDGSVDLLDYPIYKNNAAASVNEVRPLSLPVLPTLTTTEVSNITTIVAATRGVIAATGGINPNNSIGVISLAGAAANTANCTTINATNPLLTLTLGHELPPGTVITISIAKNTTTGSVRISDGINSQTFNTGTNNVLQYITFTMGRLTDIITITRLNGNVYVDGIIYSITYSEASTGGTITSNGGADIIARGVVWSTTPIPTTALATKTTNGTGTGTFTSTLTGLALATRYYVRAYATNAAGTAYGTEVSFTTNAVAALPNVTIGTQVWQSTNLDVTTYRDGTPIPQVTDPTAWANLTTGAWCYYNNDLANGAIYGKLYNWYAVAGIHDNDPNTPNKILAPQGWHIPTDAEWTTLTTFLGGESVAGGKMKATGTSLWQSPNTDATNSSGFSGLPAGCCSNGGTFYDIGTNGIWWSSSEFNSSIAWYRNLYYNGGLANRLNYSKKNGFSVRCLRD